MIRFLMSAILSLFGIVGYSQSAKPVFDYEPQILTAQIVTSQAIDSVTQFEKIVLDAFGSKTPFYHFSNQRKFNKPYVFLIHGLGGNKDYWLYPSMPYLDYTKNLTTIKDSLLTLGFSLVIIDAKFHGERSYELNFRDASSLPPALSNSKEDAMLFYELYVSTVKELRLIMDYLEMRYQNSDLNFNIVGYSMGGALSLILNTADHRLNCVVACVPPLSRPYLEVKNLVWPEDIVNHMKSISPFFCADNQKAPVALLMGTNDFFISQDEANTFFNRISQNDKHLKFFNSGHLLPSDYIGDVLDWIVKHNKQ